MSILILWMLSWSNNVFPIKLDYSDRDIKKYYTERSQGRLVVFGDSFAETSTRKDLNETCWVFVLAKMLNYSILNYARGGTSLNYSIQMFFEYMETEYMSNDYIVFVTTSYSRLPALPKGVDYGYMSSLANYYNDEFKFKRDFKDRQKFYTNNLQAMNYMAENICTLQDFKNQIMLLYSYLNTMKNKTVMIPAFEHRLSISKLVNKEDFSLDKVSEGENIDRSSTMVDDRVCHMNTENNKVLANVIYRFFETGNHKLFNLKRFNK